jgi:hypothetical protein
MGTEGHVKPGLANVHAHPGRKKLTFLRDDRDQDDRHIEQPFGQLDDVVQFERAVVFLQLVFGKGSEPVGFVDG